MKEGRRLSPGWLAAAFGLFALDIALHLPVTDFFDSLAKRFGFFEYVNVDGIIWRNLQLAEKLNGHPVKLSGKQVIK